MIAVLHLHRPHAHSPRTSTTRLTPTRSPHTLPLLSPRTPNHTDNYNYAPRHVRPHVHDAHTYTCIPKPSPPP